MVLISLLKLAEFQAVPRPLSFQKSQDSSFSRNRLSLSKFISLETSLIDIFFFLLETVLSRFLYFEILR